MQAQVYKTYHMLDPTVFYNKEDQWALPGELTANGAMTPFYVLMALPGEQRQDFLLMEPFTPRTKDNMIGWMAVKSDPGSYGQRIVFNFPKQRLILGPQQISARLNQEPDISKELTLLNQQGSRALFGNLLVIPIKDSIVYVQPIYIRAEKSPMPELKRVVVAYADKIAMAPDLSVSAARCVRRGTHRLGGRDGDRTARCARRGRRDDRGPAGARPVPQGALRPEGRGLGCLRRLHQAARRRAEPSRHVLCARESHRFGQLTPIRVAQPPAAPLAAGRAAGTRFGYLPSRRGPRCVR